MDPRKPQMHKLSPSTQTLYKLLLNQKIITICAQEHPRNPANLESCVGGEEEKQPLCGQNITIRKDCIV
jgi:hypothetical protein